MVWEWQGRFQNEFIVAFILSLLKYPTVMDQTLSSVHYNNRNTHCNKTVARFKKVALFIDFGSLLLRSLQFVKFTCVFSVIAANCNHNKPPPTPGCLCADVINLYN